jgi:aspartyl-tRNA(Asn)/glutamyl-tRNA(Gln) amidotransferase subunit C
MAVLMSFKIEKIAELARLNLKPDEAKKLEKELEAILGYVKNLDSLDTSKVEPTSHVLNLENVFRKDEVKPSGVRDEVLKHAPQTEGKFFKVPKVVER